jgi:16S rRNA (uracil1498-N3)-methyltransferase
MQAPFFYIEQIQNEKSFITLNEETSRHVVHVLRMQNGQQLLLTDGKGNLLECEISEHDKKKCVVKVLDTKFREQGRRRISIAISLLKNVSRFEWFLEKATELGITEIIPAICERTEKQHFRPERMKNILISALQQSKQVWLPILQQPAFLKEIISKSHQSQKFIAHCMNEAKVSLTDAINASTSSQIILIGPEGDFTNDEINLAFQHHFVPVALGETRLRTETAGIVSAAILAMQ